MSRPDYAFKTPTHTWRAAAAEGVYRADPGGEEILLGRAEQQVPPHLLDEPLQRAVTAWVLARGGRSLCLNGQTLEIAPEQLDRPPPGPVRRVVSIAPSNTEILAALGAEPLLVGVDSGSDYPPLVERLPRLGMELSVDMNALADLRPDLVLAGLSVPGMERNIAALDALGLPMVVSAPLSLAGIEADLLRTGAALGREAQARAAVEQMRAGLARHRDTVQAAEPVRVFLEWWHQPMFTPAATCWSNELIELAGGVNVFRHLPGQSAEVAPEAVVAADPEVIFLSWCGVPYGRLNPQRVLRRGDLAPVTAIREGRVVPLDETFVGRPGPRVVEGVALMAEVLRGVVRKPAAGQ